MTAFFSIGYFVQTLLSGREELLNVGDLAKLVGISHSAVSHHLRHLRQLRLVRARKDGRHVYYSLDDEHVSSLFRCGLEHIVHG